jgi:DNA mismatch endonuclease (patch repair protein)
VPRERLPTDPVRSALMRRVRQRGTDAEQAVGRALRSMGIAYRKNVRSLPGSPDFANKRRKWAIFVNGCFWHHHKGCVRGTIPARNHTFWTTKFAANRSRDARRLRQVRAIGYQAILIWECETRDAHLVARKISRLQEVGAPLPT